LSGEKTGYEVVDEVASEHALQAQTVYVESCDSDST